MPPRQLFAFSQASIRAGFRQPFILFHCISTKGIAFRIDEMPIFINQALTGLRIQKLAGNTAVFYPARLFIFNLSQTAKPAMIAEGFPFMRRHFV